MTGQWPALLVACAALTLSAFLASLCRARRCLRDARAECARLRARLATYTRILGPLPGAIRTGRAVVIPPPDLAVLALLIEQDGPEGDEIAALERLLHEQPSRLDT